MWVTKLLISQVKKKDFLPQNDQIWPKIGIFGLIGYQISLIVIAWQQKYYRFMVWYICSFVVENSKQNLVIEDNVDDSKRDQQTKKMEREKERHNYTARVLLLTYIFVQIVQSPIFMEIHFSLVACLTFKL